MIYLDYSATTPVDLDVLDTYNEVVKKFIGNSNSLHGLGLESSKLLDASKNQVATLLNVVPDEVIFTSGATEANNLAIKGILNHNKKINHIITSKLEHPSILEVVHDLEGIKVDYVLNNDDGLIDLENLDYIMSDNTLISICLVNSEVGIKQDLKNINNVIKKYRNVVFHSDMTQGIGKIKVDMKYVDMASFSAHKFFGIKGIGVLIKKKNINLKPLILGGESDSLYRSGTPNLCGIVSLAKALRLSLLNIEEKENYVDNLNEKIKNYFKKFPNISINSNDYSIPHILNISLNTIKPETFINRLSKDGIYVSTKSACSSKKDNASKTLIALNKSGKEASTSIRISLSYKTTMDEVEEFLKVFDNIYNELNIESRAK